MFWLLPGPEFQKLSAGERRDQFRELVDSDSVPGVLAYEGDDAVGWCAVGPRSWYARLQRSPMLPASERDDPGMWSVNCFYTAAARRRSGVTRHLLDAAIQHAVVSGARAIEGYPVDAPGRSRIPASELYTGTVDLFSSCGFREAARRTPRRVVMRRDLR